MQIIRKTSVMPPMTPGTYQVSDGLGALVVYRPDGTHFCIQFLEREDEFEILPIPMTIVSFTVKFEIVNTLYFDRTAWMIGRLSEMERLSSARYNDSRAQIKRLSKKGLSPGKIAICVNRSREWVGRILKEELCEQ